MRIGIDPGNTGAIAILSDDLTLLSLHDMPTMPMNNKKLQINSAALAQILNVDNMNVVVYIEQVNSRPDQSVPAMFNFGMGYGIIQGVCAGLFLPITLVHPQTWKKRAGLLRKEKDLARTLAQQLYPKAELSNKNHIGRAEAILIARFGSQV